jgi:hypothetical protein
MQYYWVTDQAEYATDILFKDPAALSPLHKKFSNLLISFIIWQPRPSAPTNCKAAIEIVAAFFLFDLDSRCSVELPADSERLTNDLPGRQLPA